MVLDLFLTVCHILHDISYIIRFHGNWSFNRKLPADFRFCYCVYRVQNSNDEAMTYFKIM